MAQVTLTDASTLSWDLSTDFSAKLTATGAVGDVRTLPNSLLSSAIAGENYQMVFVQDGTGGRSIAFGSDYKVLGKFDLNPNGTTIVSIVYDTSQSFVILTSSRETTYDLNIFDFLTDETTKTKILNNDDTHDSSIVATAFNDAFDFCKANGVKKLNIPSGTYVINKVTVDSLDWFYLKGDGAILKNGTGNAIFEWTNCIRWGISGISYDSNAAAYADVIYNRVSTGSGYFNFFDCTFSNMPRAGIRANSLAGGTFTYGIQVNLCHFLDTANYSNDNQCGVELAGDGEYSKIHFNIFQGIPSACRMVDGANSDFTHNTCMEMNGDAYDASYTNGIVFCDDASNSGKIQITNNKFNHNDTGIVAIVCKGDATKPQNPFAVESNEILVNNSSTKTQAVYFENAPNSRFVNNTIRGNSTTPNDTAVVIKDSNNMVVENLYLNYFNNGVQLINSDNVRFGGKLVFENISTNEFVIDTSSRNVDCETFGFSISGYGSDVSVTDTSPQSMPFKCWLVNYEIAAGVAPNGGSIDVGFKVNGVSKVSTDASILTTTKNSFSGTHPVLTQNKLNKGDEVMFPITGASGTTAKGQDVKVYMKIIKITNP